MGKAANLKRDKFVELAKQRGRLVYYFIGEFSLHLYFFDGLLHVTIIDLKEFGKGEIKLALIAEIEEWLKVNFEDNVVRVNESMYIRD